MPIDDIDQHPDHMRAALKRLRETPAPAKPRPPKGPASAGVKRSPDGRVARSPRK